MKILDCIILLIIRNKINGSLTVVTGCPQTGISLFMTSSWLVSPVNACKQVCLHILVLLCSQHCRPVMQYIACTNNIHIHRGVLGNILSSNATAISKNCCLCSCKKGSGNITQS